MGRLNVDRVFSNLHLRHAAEAVMRGDIAALTKLDTMEAIDWTIVGAKKLTLGHLALHAPTPAMLDWLIQKGADPVARLDDGNTIPHYTLLKKDAAGDYTDTWLAVVLQHGVSPDLTGPSGWPLIVASVASPNVKAMELLAKRGANMSGMSKWNDGTAVHYALNANNMQLAARLVDLGTDPRVKNARGMNAADYYCQFNKGGFDNSRRSQFEQLQRSFKRYGLEIPCGF